MASLREFFVLHVSKSDDPIEFGQTLCVESGRSIYRSVDTKFLLNLNIAST